MGGLGFLKASMRGSAEEGKWGEGEECLIVIVCVKNKLIVQLDDGYKKKNKPLPPPPP